MTESSGASHSSAVTIRSLGSISRARGDHLYATNGTRYLDLYRDGGRAILGHRTGRIVRERKNLLERGLTASLPTAYEARLFRALRRLFPDSGEARIYATYDRAVTAVALFLGLSPGEMRITDPVMSTAPGELAVPVGGVIWRPFLPSDLAATPDGSTAPLLPILPVPGEMTQTVLFPGGDGPPSDVVPADRLASLERAISDLVASGEIRPLQLPGFRAIGPYLIPLVDDRAGDLIYNKRFAEFLRHGILISPERSVPSISPCEVSDGERARTVEIAGEIVENEEVHHGD